MDMFDYAGLLFGGSRTAPDAKTVTATGAGASDGGEVGITLDADVTPAEDTGVEGDADQTIIDLPTSPDVDEGDELIVTLVGDGPLKTPVVTANPGSGDRMRALANSAKTVADAAQSVAEAVNQHFFADTNGIHVTEATQEDWGESPTGANVLINSIGQLFRDGLNNLLTLTTENGARALTIWDGLGNAAENIRAVIGDTIQLGNKSSGNYLTLDDTGLEIYNEQDGSTYSAKIGPSSVGLLGGTFTMDSSIQGGSASTIYDTVLSHVLGKVSFIRLRAISERGSGTKTSVITARADKIEAIADNGTIYAYASGLLLDYYGSDGSTTVPMEQVIATFEKRWRTLGMASTGGTTHSLPKAGTYLLMTGHNSTAGLNGIWIVRTGGNNAFRIAGGANVTVTCSGTSVTTKTSGGTVNVFAQLVG